MIGGNKTLRYNTFLNYIHVVTSLTCLSMNLEMNGEKKTPGLPKERTKGDLLQ